MKTTDMKGIKIISTHNTLTEAVAEAKIDLSYNESLAWHDIKITDQQVSKAFVTEDGIFYIYESDCKLLNKFEPFIHIIDNSGFSEALIFDKMIAIFHRNYANTKRNRRIAARNGDILTTCA